MKETSQLKADHICRFEQLEDRRVLATLMVNSFEDLGSDNDNGDLTLREAIRLVNRDYFLLPGSTTGDVIQIDSPETLGDPDVVDKILFDPSLFDNTLPDADGILREKIVLTQAYNPNVIGYPTSLHILEDVIIDAGIGFEVELSAENLPAQRVMEIGLVNSDLINVTLRRLALTNGSVDVGGATSSNVRGGGGLLSTGNITIDTVRFQSNVVFDGNGGGMIYNPHPNEQSTLLVTNSDFIGNRVEQGQNFNTNNSDGGGLYVSAIAYGGTNVDSVVIQDSEFRDNYADDAGGAIAVVYGTNSQFLAGDLGEVLLEDILVENNSAFQSGGGIYIAAEDSRFNNGDISGIIAVRNSLIHNNTVTGIGFDPDGFDRGSSGYGGGIYVSANRSRVLLDGLSVYQNYAVTATRGTTMLPPIGQSSGGGLYVERAYSRDDDSPNGYEEYALEIVNSTFSSNEANIGGGIAFNNLEAVDYSVVRHTTITQNIAGDYYYGNLVDREPVNRIQDSSGTYGRLRSNGGGISIDTYLAPSNPLYEFDDNAFLDHTIVQDNAHLFNRYDVYDGIDADLHADALQINYSPDIGLTAPTINGLYVPVVPIGGTEPELTYNPLGALFDIPVVKSYLGYKARGVNAAFDFPGSDLLITGGLNPIPTLNGAIAFEPTGEFIDTGVYVYPDLTNLPAYVIEDAESVVGRSIIVTDQRGAPYFRVYDGDNDLEARIDIGAIELQPELACGFLLAGDYNLDCVVDAADYTVWRDTLGQMVDTPFDGADGNGNGVIDQADYDVWKENFGTSSSNPQATGLAVTAGDFNGDGITNDLDFQLWEATFGSTTNLDADGNGNGIVDLADLDIWQEFLGVTTLDTIAGDFNEDGIVDTADHALWSASDSAADANGDGNVDAADYAIWEQNFGTVHASQMPTILNGAAGTFENPYAAPVVVGLELSASGANAYDFGGFVGSGEQLRTVPTANVDRVSITFSEEVFVTQSALTLTNLDGASPSNVTNFTYDLASRTASWTFDSALADGRTLLTLSDTVYDLDHEALDGEFLGAWSLSDTGTATFPSGDGEAGGEFRSRFTILAGDTDRDNIDGATDYTHWHAIEPGMILASNTADELDGDLSFGDVSLREAVQHANAAGVPTTIVLSSGRYSLSRTGVESEDASFNDLDILSDVTIIGAGAGLTIIEGFQPQPFFVGRHVFEVKAVTGNVHRLALERVTLANAESTFGGGGEIISAESGGVVELIDSVVVNNNVPIRSAGVGISSYGAHITVLRSVFTGNVAYHSAAISARSSPGSVGSVTIGDTVFALNTGFHSQNVGVTSSVEKINLGGNVYDEAVGGFFDTTPGLGDHLGVPDYVVTTIADTFDHTDDAESLSVREAIDLANQAPGASEIWLPAWNYVLTRDRVTYGGGSATDTDIAFGDLDISESVVIRGIKDQTTIAWKGGVIDKVFDLLGDYNGDGQVDGVPEIPDLWAWFNTIGWGAESQSQWELHAADGDDDGDVDNDDYLIWTANYGNTLDLFNIGE